jgi:NMD protein affecting ribosome stability and mRNA decay
MCARCPRRVKPNVAREHGGMCFKCWRETAPIANNLERAEWQIPPPERIEELRVKAEREEPLFA